MEKQNETLHYHHYCIGHGFQKYIDEEWRTCSQCGDYVSIYQFSFDSKEEFVKKHVYDNYLSIFQNDEDSLHEAELTLLADKESLEWARKHAEEVYDELFY